MKKPVNKREKRKKITLKGRQSRKGETELEKTIEERDPNTVWNRKKEKVQNEGERQGREERNTVR